MYPQQAEEGKDIRQVARARQTSQTPDSRQLQDPARLQAHQLPTPSTPGPAHPQTQCPQSPQTGLLQIYVLRCGPDQPCSAHQPISPFSPIPNCPIPDSSPACQAIFQPDRTGIAADITPDRAWMEQEGSIAVAKQGKPPPETFPRGDWAGRPKLAGQGAMLHLEPATAESVASCYSVSLLRPFCPCLPLTRAC
jgi:hypothetical protein